MGGGHQKKANLRQWLLGEWVAVHICGCPASDKRDKCERRPFADGRRWGEEQETKERARAIEEKKGSVRAKESPRTKFPKLSSRVTDQRVEFGSISVPTVRRSKSNALSFPVPPSSPPVQSGASGVAPSSVGALIGEDLWTMAVQCSTLNAENCEFMLDTGSEEYVFNPGFPPRGKVLSQPLGMRPPMLVRLGNQDMKLCGPSGAANCRVALQFGTVSKNVLCDGEMIDAGK